MDDWDHLLASSESLVHGVSCSNIASHTHAPFCMPNLLRMVLPMGALRQSATSREQDISLLCRTLLACQESAVPWTRGSSYQKEWCPGYSIGTTPLMAWHQLACLRSRESISGSKLGNCCIYIADNALHLLAKS